jgi:hypothetical protein
MSVVQHCVKVTGKSKADLIKGLQAAITELGGETETVGHTIELSPSLKTVNNLIAAGHGEEMEEVESQYAGAQPSAHLSIAAGSVNAVNDVDSEGLPWDARIHSSSRETVKSGVWKKRKGVDDALFSQVKAELYARRNQGQPVTHAAAMMVPGQPVAQLHAAPPVQAVAPVAAPAPLPPAMNGGHTLATFIANFPMTIGKLITDGKITQDYVNTLNAHFGVTEIWMINDEQKAVVFEEFIKYGLVTRVG